MSRPRRKVNERAGRDLMQYLMSIHAHEAPTPTTHAACPPCPKAASVIGTTTHP